jgi:SEC-C motif domain protein
MRCLCHSGQEYMNCCAPYHNGKAPLTPTALMRSRYSAYALGNSAYIMETTHSSHPDKKKSQAEWETQIKAFSKGADFTGLEILESYANFVTFRADLGSAGSFTEKSEFEEEEGRWRYKRAITIT